MADIATPSTPKKSLPWLRSLSEIVTAIVSFVNGITNTKVTTPLVETDTISEKTGGNGVVIDGVELKDGQVNALALGNAVDTGKITSVVVELTATEIVGTEAGDIGHADGAILLADAAVGEGNVAELLGCVALLSHDTDTYTGGADDVKVYDSNGVALTAAVLKAKLVASPANAVYKFAPIDAIATPGKGFRLKGTAYTQPGTANGKVRMHITYRLHTTQF